MGGLAAVEDALLDQGDSKVIRKSVNDACPYTSAGSAAGDQDGIGMDLIEHAH